MSKKKLPNSLWAFRKVNGLSQKKSAYFLGHSTTSQLSHYERGVKRPNLVNALKLEIIYHVPVAFLFRDLHQQLKEDIQRKEEKLRKRAEEA